MIFIQRGVYFLSSSLGEGIENTQTVGQNHITSWTMRNSFYQCLSRILLNLDPFCNYHNKKAASHIYYKTSSTLRMVKRSLKSNTHFNSVHINSRKEQHLPFFIYNLTFFNWFFSLSYSTLINLLNLRNV